MNSLLKSFFILYCAMFSTGCATDKKADQEYQTWTQRYHSRAITTSRFHDPPMNLRMVVTVVTGEVESTALTKMTETERFYQQLRFEKRGFEVYTNGDISGFSFDSIGAKGSCCNKLSPSEMKRLEVLTARLPTDRGRLPPPGERVVVQTTRGKQWKVRVYDRSKASPEIGQILELIDKRH